MEFTYSPPPTETETLTSYELSQLVCNEVLVNKLLIAIKWLNKFTGLGLYNSKQIVDIIQNEVIECYNGYSQIMRDHEKDALYDFGEGVIVASVIYHRRNPSSE